jgi:hypothetical protein
VLRRSPVASRPPSAYRLVKEGRFYEVWQRPETPERPTIEHLSLGDRLEATGRPSCRDMDRLARRAGEGGVLAFVRRPPSQVLTRAGEPSDPFTIERDFAAPARGRYGVWLGGAGFHRRVETSIDGRSVEWDRHKLSNPQQYHPFGFAELTRGRHRLKFEYGDLELYPGTAGARRTLGPIVVGRTTAASPVSQVPPSRARELCAPGQRLDWVEALGP